MTLKNNKGWWIFEVIEEDTKNKGENPGGKNEFLSLLDGFRKQKPKYNTNENTSKGFNNKGNNYIFYWLKL